MERTIRLAIAGLRHPHIETIIDEARLRPDVELVAIAEPDEHIRADNAARLQVPGFVDHTAMLAAVPADVLGVGAINADRGAIVVEALQSGLHVLADKPLCTTLADLEAIEAAWWASDRLLAVAFEKRFYPATLALERVLAAGELGALAMISASAPHKLSRARRPAWMFARDSYGGIVNDLAVHDLDLFLRFTGARRGRVRALVGNHGNADRPEFQDTGLVSIGVPDGPTGSFEVHWMSPEAADYHGDYRMRLVGTNGTAELQWKDNLLTVATHDRPPRVETLGPGLRPAEDFFDAVLTRRAPQTSAEASLAATRLALLAQQSAEQDVELPWDLSWRAAAESEAAG